MFTLNTTQRWKKSERDMSASRAPSGETRSRMHVQFCKNTTSSCRPKWSMRKLTRTQEDRPKPSKNTRYYNSKDPGNPRTNTPDWSAKISRKSAFRPTPTSASRIGCTPWYELQQKSRLLDQIQRPGGGVDMGATHTRTHIMWSQIALYLHLLRATTKQFTTFYGKSSWAQRRRRMF